MPDAAQIRPPVAVIVAGLHLGIHGPDIDRKRVGQHIVPRRKGEPAVGVGEPQPAVVRMAPHAANIRPPVAIEIAGLHHAPVGGGRNHERLRKQGVPVGGEGKGAVPVGESQPAVVRRCSHAVDIRQTVAVEVAGLHHAAHIFVPVENFQILRQHIIPLREGKGAIPVGEPQPAGGLRGPHRADIRPPVAVEIALQETVAIRDGAPHFLRENSVARNIVKVGSRRTLFIFKAGHGQAVYLRSLPEKLLHRLQQTLARLALRVFKTVVVQIIPVVLHGDFREPVGLLHPRPHEKAQRRIGPRLVPELDGVVQRQGGIRVARIVDPADLRPCRGFLVRKIHVVSGCVGNSVHRPAQYIRVRSRLERGIRRMPVFIDPPRLRPHLEPRRPIARLPVGHHPRKAVNLRAVFRTRIAIRNPVGRNQLQPLAIQKKAIVGIEVHPVDKTILIQRRPAARDR